MDRCHESFEALVADRVAGDPQALIYGVTSAPGDSAVAALSDETKSDRHNRLRTAMSFGDPLPERVVRAVLVAGLANILDGHAAMRSQLAQAVAGMLDDPALPTVPVKSNGGAGEILALGSLCQLAQRLTDHLFLNPHTAELVGYDEWSVKPLHMAQNGWAEEARTIVSPTLLSLGGFGQNDVPVLNFLARRPPSPAFTRQAFQ